MKPRKGYVKAYETEEGWKKEKKDCLIHGFFGWNDGYSAEPMAVVEFDNGTVQIVAAEDIVFTENHEKWSIQN